jgi:regulator of RNase E activity RraB
MDGPVFGALHAIDAHMRETRPNVSGRAINSAAKGGIRVVNKEGHEDSNGDTAKCCCASNALIKKR